MKITRSYLNQIIQEEVSATLQEKKRSFPLGFEGRKHQDHSLGRYPLWMFRDDNKYYKLRDEEKDNWGATDLDNDLYWSMDDYTEEQWENNEAIGTIFKYVSWGPQPTEEQRDIIREVVKKGEYPDLLRWYNGPAYRGTTVTEQWLIDFLTSQTGRRDVVPRKEKQRLYKKHSFFNIFKRLRGEITRKVDYMYQPSGEFADIKIESWSRSKKMALGYATGGGRALYHQQRGVEDALGSAAETSKILAIVMESKSSGRFIDLEPLYPIVPMIRSEAQIKEVPCIHTGYGGIRVQKLHIPYKAMKDTFSRIQKGGKISSLALAIAEAKRMGIETF